MQLRRIHRDAILAPLLVVVGVIGVYACSGDASAPAVQDDFSEQVMVGMRVRAEVNDVSGSSSIPLGSSAQLMTVAVMPDYSGSVAAFNRTGSSPVVIRHFKDRDGRVHSLGALRDESGTPPKFLYAFENGRIKAIVHSQFRRQGKGWLRERSRVTTFDSLGHPQLQVVFTPDLSGQRVNAGAQGFAKFTSDALSRLGSALLPAELHAEEAGCMSEWLAYAAASFVLASTSTALTAAGVTCVQTGATCAAVEKAMALWLAALAAWNATFDRLAECQMREMLTGDGSGGTGGGSGEIDQIERIDSITDAVQQFIDDSIASGHFACTSSGDYCVFYAS